MKTYSETLGILLASPHYKARRAASCLVCAEVVKANPIPSPAVCDAEMRELFAE